MYYTISVAFYNTEPCCAQLLHCFTGGLYLSTSTGMCADVWKSFLRVSQLSESDDFHPGDLSLNPVFGFKFHLHSFLFTHDLVSDLSKTVYYNVNHMLESLLK